MRRTRLLSPPPFAVKLLRTLPLSQRGVLFILCGLLLVFGVFGGFSVFSVSTSAERALDSTRRSVRVAAERLDRRLRHQRSGIARVARWPGIATTLDLLQSGRTDIPPPWITLHYLTSDEHDFGDVVFVTDRHGTVLWTKPPGTGLLNRDMSAYGALRRVLDGADEHISDLHTDDSWPGPHLLVAAPIRNAKNEVVGALGSIVGPARLRAGELFEELKAAADEEGVARAYLLDQNGMVVTTTSEDGAFTRADAAVLRDRTQSAGTPTAALRDGKLIAVHPLSVAGWSVVFEQPTVGLYKDVYQLGWNLLVIAVLLTMLALIVWIPFVESFIRPIRTLTAEAQRIASGDLSHSIPSDGRDEITTLAVSLDYMRTHLQSSQQKLQAQVIELNEMNRLKSEFIGNLSHEFRTPMHVMRGYLDLMVDGVFGELPAELREPVATVSRQYDALWEIVESCLRLAKIDAGKERVHIETFDLSALIRQVMDEFTLQFRDNGLRALVCTPGACQVRSDRAKIQHILRNLVGNAVKFTEHGEVEVSLKEGPDPGTVTLQVRDTGIGIAEADQRVIFDRFRQVDGSMTRLYDGVGLGLSIASELTRLLGGTISVVSTVGQGSTFAVVLPRVLLPQEGSPRQPSADERPGLSAETVSGPSLA